MNEFEIYKEWCKTNGLKDNNAKSLELYMNRAEEKEVYTIKDMMKLLGDVSYSTASRVMRQVRAVSNLVPLKGRIHKKDWNNYLERTGGTKNV